jgi:hypothetical protein
MVTLIAVLLLLSLVGLVLVTGLHIAGTNVSDSGAQNQSVEALMLAESGLERAVYNYSVSGTCDATGIGAGATKYGLGNGNFMLVSSASPVRPVVSGSYCVVRVSGTVGKVTRTVDGSISMTGGGAITASASTYVKGQVPANTALTLSYAVPAGASILIVGASFSNTQDNAAPTATATYGATTMTALAPAFGGNPWPRAQIFYLTSPPAGTATVSVSVNKTSEIVFGAMAFSSVNTATGATAPFDVAAVTAFGPNATIATIPITPVTSGAWVFEAVTIDSNDTTTMTAQPSRLLRWYDQSNGNVRGGASTIGPISPVVAQNPQWTWNGGNNKKWSQAAVALRPGGGSPQLVRWTEVVN